MSTTPDDPDSTERSPLGQPSPLSPVEDELPQGRFRRRGLWLVAAAVSVVVIAGGGALALSGGGEDSTDGDGGVSTDGIATVDGSQAEEDDGGSGGGNTSEANSEADLQDAMLEYAQCMRDHGVDMPDPDPGGDGPALSPAGPGGGPGGGLNEELEAAQEACQSILDDAGATRDPPSAEEQAEMQDKQVEVAECMRERGHEMADPGTSGGALGFAPDSQDEQFFADLDECGEQAGLRRGGG